MAKPPATKPKIHQPRTYATGGGNATASGVNFQQSLGALFGLWMLTEALVDHRLQLGAAKITTIRMETEAPLDDALALTSAGGIIAAQAKNKLSLAKSLDSEFGKTVDQIVRQWCLSRGGAGDLGWNRPLDLTRDRLLIVVGPGSPATVRAHLATGLEARRQPGKPILTADETKALVQFDACVRLAWAKAAPTEPLTDDILREIGALTYVHTIDPAGVDRAAWTASLEPVLTAAVDAPSVLNLLERIAGDLMSARGGRSLPALRNDLIGRGAKLAARPDYRNDIATLGAYSQQTEQSLRGLEVIEPDPGVTVGIARHCQAAVNAAALAGNLLLIGEPGAGKSAVINALSRALRIQGHDVVELAVDRFSVESLEGLTRQLGLGHDLPAVLGAWDGPGPAFLLIDALDAGRGGSAEAAFKRLIESVIELGGRWTVVASIRTFDLRQGRSFRTLFKGTPPEISLQGDGFGNVRHLQVPTWSEAEFAELLAQSPRLADVITHSPTKLRELAMVPFNTRLLADLVSAGAVSQDFTPIDSQIALLDLYWERRVEHHGAAAEVCLHGVVEQMAANRVLRASKVKVAAVNPAALDALTHEGVLVLTDQQRSVQFRHHLLFDYIASRVYLDAQSIVDGAASFPKSQAIGLVLAPAMCFLLQSLWASDADHRRCWTAVSHLLGGAECDPVIRSVAARMAAELPATAADIEAFASAIVGGNIAATVALPHVAGAVAVRLEDDASTALAPWVNLELKLSKCPAPVASVLRMLGFMLVSRVNDPGLRADLGAAVRALLAHGYQLDDSRSLATPAIGLVAQTMATDVAASVDLLREPLTDKRFNTFGSEELPALAREIGVIAPVAPSFAVEIFESAYARQVTDRSQRAMGGGRILNLTTNPKQDFEHSRWVLKEYFPKFLAASPAEATQAVLAAIVGFVERQHRIPEGLPERPVRVLNDVIRLQPDHSHIWAHDAHPQYANDADALLSSFETFLESANEPVVLAAADFAIGHAKLAVIWSRLFMAAAARGGPLADKLLPFAIQTEFIITPDTRKDAIDLVAACYADIDEADRASIEYKLLDYSFTEFAHPEVAREGLLRRLFGTIGIESLVTEEAKAILGDAPALGDASIKDTQNQRLFQISTGSMEPDNYYWMDNAVRAAPEVEAMIVDIENVREVLQLQPGDNGLPVVLEPALSALTRLKATIDVADVPDATLTGRADGMFAQGVHKLIQSDQIDADTPLETVDLIGTWIEAACASPHPEVEEDTEVQFENFASWGSPAARIDGAKAALDLCLKRPELYLRFAPLIDRMLDDPHPAVRLNGAQRLVRIWDIDRPGFWKRASRIVDTEDNRSVLDGFVTQPLSQLMRHGAHREVADLVLPLVERLPAGDPRNDTIRDHLVQITLSLWIRFAFQDAEAVVRGWISAAVDNVDATHEVIQWLRDAYTAGLRGVSDAEKPGHRALALALLGEAVGQAADEIADYAAMGQLDVAQTARARSAVQIIDTACQQLYFSSGVFQHGDQQDQRPPMSIEDGAIFVHEIAPILRRIGENGSPHTVYYLIQLLEHLIEADPPEVFDLIAFAVLRGGQESGYQFEHMAADLMVKLVGRYLADHKEIFEQQERRSALVDTLETFVDAGWPAVRRLFYRLPELLQ